MKMYHQLLLLLSSAALLARAERAPFLPRDSLELLRNHGSFVLSRHSRRHRMLYVESPEVNAPEVPLAPEELEEKELPALAMPRQHGIRRIDDGSRPGIEVQDIPASERLLHRTNAVQGKGRLMDLGVRALRLMGPEFVGRLIIYLQARVQTNPKIKQVGQLVRELLHAIAKDGHGGPDGQKKVESLKKLLERVLDTKTKLVVGRMLLDFFRDLNDDEKARFGRVVRMVSQNLGASAAGLLPKTSSSGGDDDQNKVRSIVQLLADPAGRQTVYEYAGQVLNKATTNDVARWIYETRLLDTLDKSLGTDLLAIFRDFFGRLGDKGLRKLVKVKAALEARAGARPETLTKLRAIESEFLATVDAGTRERWREMGVEK